MVKRILNCCFFALVIILNYLANALPINGKNTGELSDQYPNLFVPAGVTFSIWGLIYLLLLIFCVIQFRKQYDNLMNKLSIWFMINCALNASWILAWHYEFVALSLLIMLGILFTLVAIVKILHQHTPVLMQVAFGIYLGWICIATIANITALLVTVGWSGLGLSQEVWTITMILVGSVVASTVMLRLGNPFMALSLLWAFLGIIIKRQDDYFSIVVACIAAMMIVVAAALFTFRNRRAAVHAQ
ncbi:MAG: tryptophan-rich sensory protein [Cyclobacteriaceae bacterium]|nr:tryptophan-rich sensory protein [Cyclobacteriaceae bacterium]